MHPLKSLTLKCLWKGHIPEVSRTDNTYNHVYCEDCTKPLGAFSHDISLEEWMKMGQNQRLISIVKEFRL